MSKELKPCPFCGSEAIVKYHRTKTVITPFGNESHIPIGKGYWTIGCKTYDCIMYHDEFTNQPRLMFCDGSKQFMIDRWNRRVSDEDRRDTSTTE